MNTNGASAFESNEGQVKLKRGYKLRDLVLFGLAFTTLVGPPQIYGILVNVTGGTAAMSYAIAMMAMIVTAKSYGYMSNAFPYAGSTYSFTQRGLNEWLGFFTGWAIYLTYAIVPMVVIMIGAEYASVVSGVVPYPVFAVLIVLVIAVVAHRGGSLTSKVNFVVLFVVAVVVAVFIVSLLRAVFMEVALGTLLTIKPFYNADTYQTSTMFAGAAIACYSFIGFDSITTLSEEALNPKKDIGRAGVLVCLICGSLAILQSYLAQIVWPEYTTLGEETAFYDIAYLTGGAALAAVFSGIVVLNLVLAGLASITSATRIMYGMGRDGVLPTKFFAYLHPKHRTPTFNIIFLSVLGIVGALLFKIQWIVELMNFGCLFGFIFVNFSVITHYYHRQKQRKLFKYLILPGFGSIVCLYLWSNLSSFCLIVGGIWMLVGFVYLLITTKGFKIKPKIYEEE